MSHYIDVRNDDLSEKSLEWISEMKVAPKLRLSVRQRLSWSDPFFKLTQNVMEEGTVKDV